MEGSRGWLEGWNRWKSKVWDLVAGETPRWGTSELQVEVIETDGLQEKRRLGGAELAG